MFKKMFLIVLLMLIVCGCQNDHYSTSEVKNYLDEKYPNQKYTVDENYVEVIYDRDDNTKRTWTVENTETGKQCYVNSVQHYKEHVYYDINDNCEDIFK